MPTKFAQLVLRRDTELRGRTPCAVGASRATRWIQSSSLARAALRSRPAPLQCR